jgi:endonuclease G
VAYERADNFRADPSIPTSSASHADYCGSGYDRGHLIPAADLKWSVEALADSFYTSNMSPQVPEFNRGIWSKLEAIVRSFAVADGPIHVVTGPIRTNGPFPSIGENGASIPDHYFKVILDYNEPGLKVIGFNLPNAGSPLPLTTYATTVDQVESVTGLDFFYLIPDNLEQMLESQLDISLWDFIEFQASLEEREDYLGIFE